MGEENLNLFNAQKVGQIGGGVAGELVASAKATPVLRDEEKRLVEPALSSLFKNNLVGFLIKWRLEKKKAEGFPSAPNFKDALSHILAKLVPRLIHHLALSNPRHHVAQFFAHHFDLVFVVAAARGFDRGLAHGVFQHEIAHEFA